MDPSIVTPENSPLFCDDRAQPGDSEPLCSVSKLPCRDFCTQSEELVMSDLCLNRGLLVGIEETANGYSHFGSFWLKPSVALGLIQKDARESASDTLALPCIPPGDQLILRWHLQEVINLDASTH
jgi:hypothetical protein